MTVYNKTTSEKKYGSGLLSLILPASGENGVRGSGVTVNVPKNAAIAKDWQKFQADCAAGDIEIDYSAIEETKVEIKAEAKSGKLARSKLSR